MPILQSDPKSEDLMIFSDPQSDHEPVCSYQMKSLKHQRHFMRIPTTNYVIGHERNGLKCGMHPRQTSESGAFSKPFHGGQTEVDRGAVVLSRWAIKDSQL